MASLIDYLLIAIGLYFFYGVAFKPGFFWERGRIARTRSIIGDRNTTILYIVLAILMLGVGIYGAYGGLG